MIQYNDQTVKKFQRIGGSYFLLIPKPWIRSIDWDETGEVVLSFDGSKITIHPKTPKSL